MLDVSDRADSKTPYGPKSEAHYADPGYQSDGKARYPLDSEEHCKAAWSYINQSANAAKYTPEQLKQIKGRIRAAGEKFGITFADDKRDAEFDDGLVPVDDEYRADGWDDAEDDEGEGEDPDGDERMFLAEDHPRAPKGAGNGGQFAKKADTKPATQQAAPAKTPAPAHAHHDAHPARPAHVDIPKGVLGYDPASNHGTGYGKSGGDPRVHTLQQALNRLGFTDSHGKQLADDGKLGPLTTAAVRKAQQALGLKADGLVTVELLQRLAGMKAGAHHQSRPHPAHRPAHKSTPHKSAPYKAPPPETEVGGGRLRSAATGMCTRAFDFEFDGPGGDGRTLEGYAATFGTPARIRDLQGDFDEVIHPGAFARSIARRMPVLQFDHGKDPAVGGAPIGKIRVLEEDSRGLHVVARLFADQSISRVREAIAEQAITGMSFRFTVPKDGDKWSRRAQDVDLRDIYDTDTHELGPVVFPAYDTTSVSVRSILSGLSAAEMRELIHELADLGLAVDLQDLTGRPDARSAGGGDPGTTPRSGARVPNLPLTDLRTTERALKALGVL